MIVWCLATPVSSSSRAAHYIRIADAQEHNQPPYGDAEHHAEESQIKGHGGRHLHRTLPCHLRLISRLHFIDVRCGIVRHFFISSVFNISSYFHVYRWGISDIISPSSEAFIIAARHMRAHRQRWPQEYSCLCIFLHAPVRPSPTVGNHHIILYVILRVYCHHAFRGRHFQDGITLGGAYAINRCVQWVIIVSRW